MKLFFSLLCISLSTLLIGQSCNAPYFSNQQAVDDFVTQHSATCSRASQINIFLDLDYSGLSFLDTIDALYITQGGGAAQIDILGLENVVHVEVLQISHPNIINADMLDFQSIGTSIQFREVDLVDFDFLQNLTSLNYLSLTEITFSDPSFNIPLTGVENIFINKCYSGIPSFNALTNVADKLSIVRSNPSSNLSEFPALDSARLIVLKENTNLSSLSGINSTIISEELSVHDNYDLSMLDFSSLPGIQGFSFGGIQVANVVLPSRSLTSIIFHYLENIDLSFMNTVPSVETFEVLGGNIQSLQVINNLLITKVLRIRYTPLLTSLNGPSFSPILETIQLRENSVLHDISALENVSTVSEVLSVFRNPSLADCCVLKSLVDPSNPDQSASIRENLRFCTDEGIDRFCLDLDNDLVLDYLDNCVNTPNNDQADLDNDGVGDACDTCPSPVSFQLETQAEVDNFETTVRNCVVQNLFIEGADEIVDLRPLSFLTRINGKLALIENENLQSLAGLENIERIGGFLELFSNEALTNIDALSNLNSIGGIQIGETNLLESIDALSSLDSIQGNIDVNGNTSLAVCCIFEPFISGEKYHAGTISIGANATGCNTITEINSGCQDDDNDDVVNVKDNCPNLFNNRQDDFDKDGIGDICDNCPQVFNPNQVNQDGDFFGDACDRCPTISGNSLDSNNNGIGDDCEGLAGQESGFMGVGTNDPDAKMEIAAGDLFLKNSYRGVILRSADGSCFRMKVQNDGTLVSVPIDCPDN